MKRLRLILIGFLVSLSSFGQQPLDSLLKPVKFRNIGPFRGGRSVCATGVVGDPLTYFMGTTGGGLWKTEDGGQNWFNISDGYFSTSSVGAIAVSESQPNIVYVGMGEHAPRGVMTSYGDGVYKSNDGGKSWVKLGLEKTQYISRIVIDPHNPNVVIVAAQGPLHGNSSERGIYKSVDGGKSWKNVLYINDRTGCSELSMDFNNPSVLYASMWEHQRLPWQVISGGPGSGLYKSTDGGDSWKKMEKGLPNEMGKMAISVSRANSDKVYALIESNYEKEAGGLYVSNDAGKNWRQVTNDHRLIQRSWYYIEVFTDPKDENTVYVMSATAYRSIDGGTTWEEYADTHGDYHDLWINPNNSKNLVLADDGGASISFNYGKTWSRQDNMPTAQIYRINADNHYPYRLYGGQQDNSSLRIESIALGGWSIDRENWTSSAGGESAYLAFDPNNPRYVLGGSYLGTIEVIDTKTTGQTNIMAAPIQYLSRETKDMKYRYNWNAPIIWSQHEKDTYYHGAQLLLKTTDLGRTWTEISPDLTRNEKSKQGKGGAPFTNEAVGAENYGTLSDVRESSLEKGVIYTGSDDGYVYVTKDGGKTWNNVTPKNLAECLINSIEVSPHDPGTAYIATTRFKFNDHTPGLYKTTNYGKTWVNISTGIPNGAYTRVIREDTKRKDLLFAGTELGLYISWNGGKQWEAFKLNLPVTPITDMLITHDDLAIATMGRSFWILDDLELIRQINTQDLKTKIYQPSNTVLGNWGSPLNRTNENFSGSGTFSGVNPANGLVIYYSIESPVKDQEVSIVITDSNGKTVRKLSSKADENYQSYGGGPPSEPTLSAKKGMNRMVWDLRYPILTGAPKAYIEGSFNSHRAIPGNYELTFTYGDYSKKVPFQIADHPLAETNMNDFKEWDEFMKTMEAHINDMHHKVNSIYTSRGQLEEISKKLSEGNNNTLKTEVDALISKMKTWDEAMIQRKSKAYDDVENFLNGFTANYMFVFNQSESQTPRVNEPNRKEFELMEKQWTELNKTAIQIIETELPAINKKLWEAGIGAVR